MSGVKVLRATLRDGTMIYFSVREAYEFGLNYGDSELDHIAKTTEVWTGMHWRPLG